MPEHNDHHHSTDLDAFAATTGDAPSCPTCAAGNGNSNAPRMNGHTMIAADALRAAASRPFTERADIEILRQRDVDLFAPTSPAFMPSISSMALPMTEPPSTAERSFPIPDPIIVRTREVDFFESPPPPLEFLPTPTLDYVRISYTTRIREFDLAEPGILFQQVSPIPASGHPLHGNEYIEGWYYGADSGRQGGNRLLSSSGEFERKLQQFGEEISSIPRALLGVWRSYRIFRSEDGHWHIHLFDHDLIERIPDPPIIQAIEGAVGKFRLSVNFGYNECRTWVIQVQIKKSWKYQIESDNAQDTSRIELLIDRILNGLDRTLIIIDFSGDMSTNVVTDLWRNAPIPESTELNADIEREIDKVQSSLKDLLQQEGVDFNFSILFEIEMWLSIIICCFQLCNKSTKRLSHSFKFDYTPLSFPEEKPEITEPPPQLPCPSPPHRYRIPLSYPVKEKSEYEFPIRRGDFPDIEHIIYPASNPKDALDKIKGDTLSNTIKKIEDRLKEEGGIESALINQLISDPFIQRETRDSIADNEYICNEVKKSLVCDFPCQLKCEILGKRLDAQYDYFPDARYRDGEIWLPLVIGFYQEDFDELEKITNDFGNWDDVRKIENAKFRRMMENLMSLQIVIVIKIESIIGDIDASIECL